MAIRSYLLMQRLHTWVLDDHTPCGDDCVLLVRFFVGLFVVTVTGPGQHQNEDVLDDYDHDGSEQQQQQSFQS